MSIPPTVRLLMMVAAAALLSSGSALAGVIVATTSDDASYMGGMLPVEDVPDRDRDQDSNFEGFVPEAPLSTGGAAGTGGLGTSGGPGFGLSAVFCDQVREARPKLVSRVFERGIATLPIPPSVDLLRPPQAAKCLSDLALRFCLWNLSGASRS